MYDIDSIHKMNERDNLPSNFLEEDPEVEQYLSQRLTKALHEIDELRDALREANERADQAESALAFEYNGYLK